MRQHRTTTDLVASQSLRHGTTRTVHVVHSTGIGYLNVSQWTSTGHSTWCMATCCSATTAECGGAGGAAGAGGGEPDDEEPADAGGDDSSTAGTPRDALRLPGAALLASGGRGDGSVTSGGGLLRTTNSPNKSICGP